MRLFHCAGRVELHALDDHRVDRKVGAVGRNRGNLVDHLYSFESFTEHGVGPVKLGATALVLNEIELRT